MKQQLSVFFVQKMQGKKKSKNKRLYPFKGI